MLALKVQIRSVYKPVPHNVHKKIVYQVAPREVCSVINRIASEEDYSVRFRTYMIEGYESRKTYQCLRMEFT
jgi:hypothetical protein